MSEIQVKVELVFDEETGERFILPTTKQLEREKKTALELIRESDELGKSKRREDKLNSQKKREAGQWLLDSVERLRIARETLKEQATVTTYTLQEPTYGEYLECEKEATEENDGNPFVNSSRLNYELLKVAFKGDVKELSPVVAKYLESKVFNMIHPNASQIPFLS